MSNVSISVALTVTSIADPSNVNEVTSEPLTVTSSHVPPKIKVSNLVDPPVVTSKWVGVVAVLAAAIKCTEVAFGKSTLMSIS